MQFKIGPSWLSYGPQREVLGRIASFCEHVMLQKEAAERRREDKRKPG
jgi:hypothetical protein